MDPRTNVLTCLAVNLQEFCCPFAAQRELYLVIFSFRIGAVAVETFGKAALLIYGLVIG